MQTISLLDKQKLKEMIAQLSKQTDACGMKIDAGIIETVALLNMLGFPTKSSCEGHIERALPYGWIKLQTPTELAEQVLSKTNQSIFYSFQNDVETVAYQKTFAKFGEEKDWDAEAEAFYDEVAAETRKKHINYNYYVDTMEKIQNEREKLRERTTLLLKDLLSFQDGSITISRKGSVKIILASAEERIHNHKELALSQRQMSLKRSKAMIRILTRFLKYCF